LPSLTKSITLILLTFIISVETKEINLALSFIEIEEIFFPSNSTTPDTGF
jgi:hypothetical protein